jgi:hypothetical protein
MSSSAAIELETDSLVPRTLITAACELLRRDILPARLSPGQKLHIAQLSKCFSVRAAAMHEPVSRRDADAAAGVLTVHFSRTEDLMKRRTLSIEDEIGQGP